MASHVGHSCFVLKDQGCSKKEGLERTGEATYITKQFKKAIHSALHNLHVTAQFIGQGELDIVIIVVKSVSIYLRCIEFHLFFLETHRADLICKFKACNLNLCLDFFAKLGA